MYPFDGAYISNGKLVRPKHHSGKEKKDHKDTSKTSAHSSKKHHHESPKAQASHAHSSTTHEEHPPHHTAEDWKDHDPALRIPYSSTDYESEAVCALSAAKLVTSPNFCWEDALWAGCSRHLTGWSNVKARVGLGTTKRLCSVVLDTGSPFSIMRTDHAREIPGAKICPCESPFMLHSWDQEDVQHEVTEYAVFHMFIPEHLGRPNEDRRWARIVVRAFCVPGTSDTLSLVIGSSLMAQEGITLDLKNGVGVVSPGDLEFRLDMGYNPEAPNCNVE
ncbi:uncharacterized protein BO95DRAFT_435095 [Aspergillus brunneoviolaceus CBS 621.78]|uniref:Uncharacterized protein n=1 Tax=Aspergillus brunneoviolaceus CBS 621.78 TaxID=1450534 RepID=A0ACD1FYX5_9EURO|nr:hypothetical protein BO95DRAFT_435095 [Aspergillus brunneoviolaceus CBS 621.78]RAH42175.1 hypothetical protein BO95DRAFT_435095 [Aspergillus brunneoviolaceus CBS 621.78]